MSLVELNLANTGKIGLEILNSEITTIQQLEMMNCTNGMQIKGSTIEAISNSTFDQNGSPDKINGGAIHTIDSDLTIIGSTFMTNQAHDGAAISFQ